MRPLHIIAAALLALLPASPAKGEGRGYALGADVSCLTEMEAQGYVFYTPGPERRPMECMQLLRDHCGVNSVRLKVWVNPKDHWNTIADVVDKAVRADSLGMRVMIDFHFSDTWADPGHQHMPRAWEGLDTEDLCKMVRCHVLETMLSLKARGVTPEWVQIGNETTPGMMLPVGSVENGAAYTALNNAGYDAVKEVFPDALAIVHLDGGHDPWRYDRMFDMLKANGGRYDMIGMSVYPYWAQQDGDPRGWEGIADACIDNIERLRAKYGVPVMITEIGMPYDEADDCYALIAKMLQAPAEGIFYWEPESDGQREGGYKLGCFKDNAPTRALDAYKLKLK